MLISGVLVSYPKEMIKQFSSRDGKCGQGTRAFRFVIATLGRASGGFSMSPKVGPLALLTAWCGMKMCLGGNYLENCLVLFFDGVCFWPSFKAMSV